VLAGALLGVLWAPVAATGGWPIAASIVSLLLLAVLSAWALVRMAPAAQGR
jgi:membrane protein implicated in regulation of membrane protease activity